MDDPSLYPWWRRLEANGWLEVVQAGALGFFVLLLAGSLLVVAAKLNFPSLGAGADLLDGLKAIVIAALGILSVPVIFDDLAIALLPLGALAGTGWGIAWAVRTTLRPVEGDAGKVVSSGVRVAIPFALICWFAALVFRFEGTHPVAADTGATLVVAVFWGGLFGAIGALQMRRSLRQWVASAWSAVRARSPLYAEGAFCGATTLALAAIIATAATLMWIIVSLVKDAPGRYFDAGDAVAYILYAVALLPNAIVSVAAIAFGAGVEVGARLTLAGEVTGPLREYSLWGWGGGSPPAPTYLLPVIPLVSCLAAGVVARRRVADGSKMLPVLLVASAVVGVAFTLVGWIAKMRLAGIGRGVGYAVVAPDVIVMFFSSFFLTGLLGVAGWKLAESGRLQSWFRRLRGA